MSTLRIIQVLFFFVYMGASALLFAEETKDALVVFKDDEVYRALPKRFLFPDVEQVLFRSADGKALHLGPGKEGVFFVLSPEGEVQVLTAPTEGKAYLDQEGRFAIWYNSLAEGIFLSSGEKITLEDPQQTRFGVSYGAEFFYLTQNNTTQVFSTEAPRTPLFSLSGFYTYKLVQQGEEFHLVGYAYLGHEEMRTHEYRRYLKVEGDYLLMNQFELADHLIMLDLNPYDKTALFLNDSEMVPQLFFMNLTDKAMQSLGMVQNYGFFLHPSFRNCMPASKLPEYKR